MFYYPIRFQVIGRCKDVVQPMLGIISLPGVVINFSVAIGIKLLRNSKWDKNLSQ